MNELKPCPFCGSETVNFAEIDSSFFAAVCGTCGAQGEQMATIREAVDAWNMRAGDEPKRMTVNVGEVAVFPNAKADKEQALKIVEEAAEVFSAWEDWDSNETDDGLRAILMDELADVIQAVANMLHAIGVDDATLAMEACRKRNEERGRYER